MLVSLLPCLALSLAAAQTAVFMDSPADSAAACPAHFTQWTSEPHAPYSPGPLRLPTMRPPAHCRTFASPLIDQLIADVSGQITDPDIRQLFSNTMPSTLDTAVAWHTANSSAGDAPYPYTFVITGDINAQWTRDSTNQLLPLLPYVAAEHGLQALVAGLVNMQAEQMSAYPFANAYKPPRRSRLTPGENSWAKSDRVVPAFDAAKVYEAKFEIDSIAAFFKLSAAYWRQTGSAEMLDLSVWRAAVGSCLKLLARLQMPTYGAEGRLGDPVVRFARTAASATETSFGNGRGNPVRYTGMVRSLFRPSDDAVILPFLVPANAMLSVELVHLADMLDALNITDAAHTDSLVARRLAAEIRQGILDHAVYSHPTYGSVYVYETDGYGSQLVMDDANVPSLLSLPYLGFVPKDDPIYRNTRRLVLSTDNPWFFNGSDISGIGSPHTGFHRVWPMSIAVAALTSDNKQEIVEAVGMLARTTAGLGLMHESVDMDDPTNFSRPWFAWCNGVVSELIIETVRRFPGAL
ncbi:hypothetical protein LPJ53_001744 [Coemansia erecta]|uniref:Glycoside hydrolase family 125 protein n=1 Tax=Coemansia erecta TaxID=147472 RepID=A0A9W7Y3D0_9FUNG|nr:hypothetical protein LPJ53_001744 [Coemansia erecta]